MDKPSFFPDSAEEAIAFLYVQNQDVSGKTPSEIYTMYLDAFYEIRKDKREKQISGWFKGKQQEVMQS